MSQRFALLSLVLLTATACGNVTEVHGGGTLVGSNAWSSGKHQLNGDITIQNGSLNLAAGVHLAMAAGVNITIGDGGSLEINGTSTEPVTITAVDASSPWGSIIFTQGADTGAGTSTGGSGIDYANIQYGGLLGGMITVDNTSVQIAYSNLVDSATYGLQLAGFAQLPGFVGNNITNNNSYAVSAEADSVGALQGYETNLYDTPIYVPTSTLHFSDSWAPLGNNQPANYAIQNLTISAAGTSNANAILTVSSTLNASAVLYMDTNASIEVDQSGNGQGALVLQGGGSYPVRVTSLKAASTSGTPAPGDWAYIKFDGNGGGALPPDSGISNAEILYGGTASDGPVWVSPAGFTNLNSVTVSYAYADGITVDGGGIANGPQTGETLSISNCGRAATLSPDAVGALLNARVTLGNNLSNAIIVNGGNITEDATWPALSTMGTSNIPYEIVGNIMAADGNTLTIAAGALVEIADGTILQFSGGSSLQISGTTAAPVTVKSLSATGNWGAIALEGNGTSNFSHAVIMNGGLNADGQVTVTSPALLNLDTVTFSGSVAVLTNGTNPCDHWQSASGLIVDNESSNVACP